MFGMCTHAAKPCRTEQRGEPAPVWLYFCAFEGVKNEEERKKYFTSVLLE